MYPVPNGIAASSLSAAAAGIASAAGGGGPLGNGGWTLRDAAAALDTKFAGQPVQSSSSQSLAKLNEILSSLLKVKCHPADFPHTRCPQRMK